MQLAIQVDHSSDAPLQTQILVQIRELILTNRLKPGARLPSSRELSTQLEISRNTVSIVYERLGAEGFVETLAKGGTFVSHKLPEESLLNRSHAYRADNQASFVARRPVPNRFRAPLLYERPKHRVSLDFRIGRPEPALFPIRTWRRLVDRTLRSSAIHMTQYGNPAGLRELRKAIADHVGPTRGITTTPDQVIVVGGCEEGLNVVARILVSKGVDVCVEDPCYRGVAFVFESYGANMVPIPVDGEGIRVDKLSSRGANLICVTPSHQFPMGWTMSLERRLRLLDWANENGAYILEDDYDSDFRYDGSPLTALRGLDSDVIYVGTFSKSIGAGIRIGYLIVPEELVGAAREAKALLDNGNSWLEQAVVAEFLKSGAFSSHLRSTRKTYLMRRDCLLDSLRTHFGAIDTSGHEGGMHLTWMLPKGGPTARQLQYAALDFDVGLYSVSDGPAYGFAKDDRSGRAVFLGYPCLAEEQIREAVQRIAKTVDLLSTRKARKAD